MTETPATELVIEVRENELLVGTDSDPPCSIAQLPASSDERHHSGA
jgi:hypothetical protein